MPEFGKIERVPLRSLWPHEASDFTPWLAENINCLGSAIGFDLELITREAAVGAFSCDLLARDLSTNHNVIIENQLAPTDHDHLGKLLTYAASLEAGVIIWVAATMRDEHRQALEWLNSKTDSATSFYGVVIEVIQIDQSRPAFQFHVVVSPNPLRGTRNAPPPTPSSRSEQYRSFFQGLIDILREQHHFTNARMGQPQNWYTFSSGLSGLQYGASFISNGLFGVELYIDLQDQALNKNFFDALNRERVAIEQEIGQNLEWQRLEDRRMSRVRLTRPGMIDMDSAQLEEIRNWGVDKLLLFRKVFTPRLRGTYDWVKAQQPPPDEEV